MDALGLVCGKPGNSALGGNPMGPVKVTLTQIHIEGLENAIYFHQKNPNGLVW